MNFSRRNFSGGVSDSLCAATEKHYRDHVVASGTYGTFSFFHMSIMSYLLLVSAPNETNSGIIFEPICGQLARQKYFRFSVRSIVIENVRVSRFCI